MAEVFLARTSVAQGLAKDLVIKKIHPAYASTREFVSMFVAEAKIALGLNHPNIVQVFDFGQVGDTFFLAMEYIDGIDVLRLLQETVRQRRQIPLTLCAYIVQEMAKGLDYAHRKADEFGEPLGIVHRDVSPQNVLVSWDGAVKIVDFGIARARGVDEEEGIVKGKYSYMAPEQARGQAVDRRADVYSAGVVLYELSCARPLFPGRGKEVLPKVTAGVIPKPSLFNKDIPPSLERVILKALARDPGERFATARDLQVALGAFQFEQAQIASDLTDSDSLARYVTEVMPADKYRSRPQPEPLSTPPPKAPASDELDMAVVAPVITDPALVERFDMDPSSADRAQTVSEVRARKHVMVLEGQVRGLGALAERLGAARSQRVVDQFFAVARNIAFKHDSHVYQADDDSVTLLVGLPVAREDDASRTIRLALALIEALDGIGRDLEPELGLAVGIQRAVAVVVYRGSQPGKVELPATERSVARRLARQARSAEILIGSQVYRVTRSAWNLEPLDTPASLRPAGDTEREDEASLRIYRLLGPKERAERLRERAKAAGDIVGRDLELKALKDAYRAVIAAGGSRHIMLVGEAGIGKRTIVNAFMASIPGGEAVVMRATTQVATMYTPFALLADMARDILTLAEAADVREINERIERVTPVLYPGQAPSREARGAMAAVGILLGAHARSPEFDADELRGRMLDVVARIRQFMEPKKPIIVIGEDIHWTDDDSLTLLRDVFKLPGQRPILGLFTTRPDERASRYAGEIGAEVMPVGELDPDSSVKLIARRFASEPQGMSDVNELARQILERTGGNPFFIQEVLDSLIERGIVAVDDEADAAEPEPAPGAAMDHGRSLLRWVERDVPLRVPTSVESVLAARIDRLPLEQKQALMHAAVFGRVCRTEAVAELLGRPARDDLDALAERGLLGGADDQYSFRNDLTMTVAYGLLPAEDRPRLHRMAAAMIPRSGLHAEGQDQAIIARHYELAGDAVEAADRYMAAASYATDMGGNADALRQLSRALKLLPPGDHARRFAAHDQREKILHRLGRRPKQLGEIRHMREEAEALGDPARLAQAHIRLVQYYVDMGKAQQASAASGPALEYARKAQDPLAEAAVLQLRASVARLTGNIEEALELCDEALELCDEGREGLIQRASILNVRGGALWNMGKLEAAIESFAETLVIYRMLELPRLEARALNNMGIIFTTLAEYEEALHHYKSALAIDQKLGDRVGVGITLGNIGQTYADLGDMDRAERYLRKAIKMATRMDDVAAMVDVLIALGQVQLQRGDTERAMDLLKRGLEMANENRDRFQETRALIYLTLARLEAGYAAEELLELTRLAVEMAEKMVMPSWRIHGMAVQGLVLSALGRTDEAAGATARAVALQAEQKQPLYPEEIFYYHAILCERAGRLDEAQRAISAAFRELEAKAGRLEDKTLEAMFLGSRMSRRIIDVYERLAGKS